MTQNPITPPAFPCIDNAGPNGQAVWRDDGMSLRDYFASHAMIAIFAGDERTAEDFDEQIVAKNAYRLANAMLKARQEGDGC